jgi:hypothetical protein
VVGTSRRLDTPSLVPRAGYSTSGGVAGRSICDSP